MARVDLQHLLVDEQGTAITLRLADPHSPLLDRGWLEVALRRHFEPLLDSWFEPILAETYPQGITFSIDERILASHPGGDRGSAPLELRMPRRRKPSGWGFLVRESRSLPENRRGLAISTLGKVIRRGWAWLGVNPATPDRISGLIEIPALAEALTLDKSDFLRSGPRGALWLAHRRVLQEVVQRQLEAWGDQRDVSEGRRRKVARPVERDLERVLVDLASEFPLIRALVERHAGGQRRLPVGEPAPSGVTGSAHTAMALSHTLEPAAQPRASDTAAEGASAPGLPEDPADEAAPATVIPLPLATSRKGAKKPGRCLRESSRLIRPGAADGDHRPR